MIVLGLAGYAGAGKDTVADYLRDAYGFVKFSFSDALYREVAAAFKLDSEDALRDRATKDAPWSRLALKNCTDTEFVELAKGLMREETNAAVVAPDPQPHEVWHSPRWILQHWGTAYRRAQDPHYWVTRAREWMMGLRALHQYPEHKPHLFVNCSVRFANEREFIYDSHDREPRWDGGIWHIRREGVAAVNGHVSETPLAVLQGERELFNNDTVERLYRGIDLMLNTTAKFVRVDPMLPAADPDAGASELDIDPTTHLSYTAVGEDTTLPGLRPEPALA